MNGGSRKWFNYFGDDGVKYAIEKDESNGETTLGGADLLSDLTAGAKLFPCRVKPRYVNAQLATDVRRRKKFTVGTVAAFATIDVGSTLEDTEGTWRIRSKRGERATYPIFEDTALDDGDAD